MRVVLTPDQKAFAEAAVQSGRLRTEEDAVAEALALWERRERFRAETLAALDAAEVSIAGGAGLSISTTSVKELAEGVKRRGRVRLAAEQGTRS